MFDKWKEDRLCDKYRRVQASAAPMDSFDLNRLLVEHMQSKQYRAAQTLIELGASPDTPVTFSYGFSIFKQPLVLDRLACDDETGVRLLVKAGADLSRKNTLTGNTALIVAVAMGRDKMVRLLLDAGAPLDQKTSIHSPYNQYIGQPVTALQIAKAQGFPFIIRMLESEPARRQALAVNPKSATDEMEETVITIHFRAPRKKPDGPTS